MAQLFRPWADTVFRVLLLGGALAILMALALGMMQMRSPWETLESIAPEQPVPFSHQHHVGGLGIDCRFCHGSVEVSGTAGMPASETCMTCHSQLWNSAPMLAPVRRSLVSGQPMRWRRVYDLPDFVYFDHSIHVHKGIGCASCHGRVDRMPLMHKAQPLHMSWCLDCHRDPRHHLRPRDAVFDLAWKAPVPAGERTAYALQMLLTHRIEPGRLADCSVCHR